MTERWLTFDEAVGTARAHLGIGIGRAEKVIREAHASGEVRSHAPLILNDDGLVGLKTRQMGVWRFSEDDLLDWLTRQQPLRSEGSKPHTITEPIEDASNAADPCETCRKMILALANDGLTKDEMRSRARREICGLSVKQFDGVWKKHAPPHLKAQGRPKAQHTR